MGKKKIIKNRHINYKFQATEGRNILLAEEVEAIKASLEQLQLQNSNEKFQMSQVEGVPEELFRRFSCSFLKYKFFVSLFVF